MIYKVHKWFIDFDKEEQWVNHMAEKGFTLISIAPLTYTFTEGTPGEYTYHIELLDSLPYCCDSLAYIRHMEASGAEFVDNHFRWAYFRKKKAKGSFDTQVSYFSRISHYGKVATLYGVLAATNLLNSIVQFFTWLNCGHQGNLVISMICIAVSLILTPPFITMLVRRQKLRMKELLSE